MARTYTVDASVFLNAFNPREAGHAESHAFLAQVHRRRLPIIAPLLLLPEVAAAVSRGRQDEALAREFAAALRRLPHLMLVPLDDALADIAADIAALHRLRGSDAVYAAVSLRFGTVLVTRDKEQAERVAAAVTTRSPGEALADLAQRGDARSTR